jgi:hypothetical protein
MIKVIPNFVSSSECTELSSWITHNHHNFVDANMNGIRKTTRYLNEDTEFPQIALEIRERLKNYLDLEDMIKPPFTKGMVASYAEPGDTCYEHTDPVWCENHYTMHCNVIVQKPEGGGNVTIEGKEFNMPEGDIICYYVSDLKHSVTEVIGSKNRLMWIFAFCVEKDLNEKH